MVDFRYHLVTIIAIFLALALGIVVGTTQLNGQVLDDLNGRINGLAGEKRDLEKSIQELRTRTESDEELVGAIAPTVAAGRLMGERVVLVSTPNAPKGLREDLVPLLEAAGASLGTQISLRPDLLNPDTVQTVKDVVGKASPTIDQSGDAVAVAGRELAAALLVPRESSTPVLTDEQATSTLEELAKGDLIDLDGAVQPRGSLVVLLTGEAVRGSDPDGVRTRVAALLSLASALDGGGKGAVISGPLTAVDEGGLIRALREDGGLSDQISSVDGVDTPQGRLATVLALREQRRGDSGQYGTGSDSDGPLPARTE